MSLKDHPDQNPPAERSLRQNQARISAILESALDCIITMDVEGLVVEFNPAAEKTFGYRREHAVGRPVAELIIPERLRDAHWAGLKRFVQSGDGPVLGRRIEMPAMRADGSEIPVELAICATKVSNQPPIFTAYLRDISDRMAADEAVRQSEARLRLVTDAAPALISYVDATGRYRFANRGYLDWFGVQAHEVEGKHLKEVLGDAAFETVRPRVEAALRGQRIQYDAQMPYKSGGTRFIHAEYVPDVKPDGSVAGFFALVTDIDERKNAEIALIESERRFKTLTAFAPVGMFETDADGNCLFVNDRWCQIAGMSAEQAIGQGWADALHPQDREQVFRLWYEAAKAGTEFDSEYRFITRQGKVTWVSGRGLALRDAAGRITGHIGTLIDITERKRIEQTRTLLASIVEASDDAIVSKDLNGVIMTWNAGAERIFGYSADEAIGRPVSILLPKDRPDEEAQILERVRTGERINHYETVRRRKDGTLLDISLTVSPLIDATGRVIGASKTARDITERKRAEAILARHSDELEQAVKRATTELQEASERARASERLAAMGTLAAGLGHDMANILLPVKVRLNALAQESSDEAHIGHITTINTALEYLQNLATSLKMLATDPLKVASINKPLVASEWWTSLQPLLKTAVPRGVTVQGEIEGCPALHIAPQQLSQAVFNLVQNAGEALAQTRQVGGTVTVSARRATVGDMVKLSVADDGPGMTDEVKAHCLEPFYSTKPRGVTTGMGLALVHAIVQQAGGALEIDSRLGEGTKFTLILPAWRMGEKAPHIACVDVSNQRMCSFAKLTLERIGFTVLSEECEQKSQPVSLWITDVTDEAKIQRFVEQNPAACVLLIGSHDVKHGDGRVFLVKSEATPSELRSRLVEAAKCVGAR